MFTEHLNKGRGFILQSLYTTDAHKILFIRSALLVLSNLQGTLNKSLTHIHKLWQVKTFIKYDIFIEKQYKLL